MKKLIQICSVLCLVMAFSIISANAQSTQKIKADVPFDFNVAGKHYNAGKYTLKISDTRQGGAIAHLTDNDGHVLDTIIVAASGDYSRSDAKLTFNNYDGQRFLSRISTSESAYRIARSSVERQVASGKKAESSRPTSIALRTEL